MDRRLTLEHGVRVKDLVAVSFGSECLANILDESLCPKGVLLCYNDALVLGPLPERESLPSRGTRPTAGWSLPAVLQAFFSIKADISRSS